jgi:hypothetical protein
MLIAVGLLIAAVGVPSGALALEFSVHPNNKSRTLTAILATGDIRAGDLEKLKTFLSQTGRKRTQPSIWLVRAEISTRASGWDCSLSTSI